MLSFTLLKAATSSFHFFVPGSPASQGSKTAYGRVVPGPDGRPRAIVNMVEQDKGLSEWRGEVTKAARLAKPSDWQQQGAFLLSTVFYMPRPKAHFKSNGQPRPDAPLFHCKRKDCDKMLRAIGDALTEVCYEDDSLIVSACGTKLYCDAASGRAGAKIFVARLDEEAARREIQASLAERLLEKSRSML